MKLFAPTSPGPNQIQGVQISTSVNSLPTPIIYGTPRCGANTIWLNGFKATPAPNTATGIGKGGKQVSSYVYNAWFIAALCEGPVAEPIIKFIDGVAYGFAFSYFTKTLTISQLGFEFGTAGQTAVPAITSTFPNEALAYREIAYVYGENYRIDPTATIPQFNFIVPGFMAGTCPLNPSTITIYVNNPPFANVTANIGWADADPARCIVDLLTAPIYGAGFPGNLIDVGIFSSPDAFNPIKGDAAYSTYCQAVGLGFSVCLDSTESASSIVQRWCELTNTAPVWTGTILKFIPYGDAFEASNLGWQAGNPGDIGLKYFSPNVTPLFSLTDDDFEQSHDPTEDPVTIDRKDIADIYNAVRLSWPDRFNGWNRNVSEAKDENHIELYGIRVDNLAEAKEFTFGAYAQISAQLRVQRNVSVDRTYKFRLSWAFCILEPMDIIEITDTTIGVINQTVRIVSMEENERGIIEFVAEIFPIGAGTAVAYPTQALSASTIFYPGAAASLVNVPFIFEPTNKMLQAESASGPTIVIGLSGGNGAIADPNWSGALIYIALTSGGDYSLLGETTAVSRMGVLNTNLGSYGGANPDNTNVLQVNLAESGGMLESVTNLQADSALPQTSLCAIINGAGALELISYTTATLVARNTYNLTRLNRGLYGTTGHTSLAGSQFLRIDPATFQVPLPPQYIGQTLYIKCVSLNNSGVIAADLSTATPYSYTPTGAGANNFTVNGSVNGRPTSNEIVLNYVFTGTVTFPQNLTGSQGSAGTGATLAASVDIRKNGISVGSMNFAAGAGGGPEVATFTFGTPVRFNSGDTMTMVAPAVVDATLADLVWSIVGQTF